MGICCSKKVQDPPLPLKIQTPNAPTKNQINKEIKEEKKVEETLAEKPKSSLSEKPKKQEANANITNVFIAPSKPEETRISTPVRTSSCTKEEVDAILIQCGRLSRSSSEKRKYSGSKRSFDFDNEKREGEEEEELVQTVSRPSPRRRRTPSRERSGSKERVGSQSQRRVSRSPNRRNETEKTKQQPAKMVSVPACEKAVVTENTTKKIDISSNNLTSSNGNSITTSKRNASPRSRSCENSNGRVSNENNNASLSRSNSRKGGEQSPFRRNPMTEIDENMMKAGGCGAVKKANQIQAQCNGKEKKNNTTSTNKAVPEQPKSCKTKEKEAVLEQCKDVKSTSKGTRSSSRRSSRDLDSNTNASNYTTSLLLEDIENYQQENTGFSLPACVSKACSIMEAVADLNSSSSDQSYGKQHESIQKKYGSVSEEPQESAGSNSYVGQQQPWHARNSVDSTERNWVACSSSNLEVEEEVEQSTNGRRRWKSGGGGGSTGSSRVSGTTASSSSSKNRVVVAGVRKDYLLPVAAASSS